VDLNAAELLRVAGMHRALAKADANPFACHSFCLILQTEQQLSQIRLPVILLRYFLAAQQHAFLA
jgi:hypothetical protein